MNTYTKHTAGNLDRWTRFLGAMLTIAIMVPAAAMSQSYSNPAPVPLLTAGTYGALASTGITGSASVNGDVGTVTGTIDVTILPTGTNWGVGDGHTSQAQTDLAAALTDASGRTNDATIANALGGQTLQRGVYGGGALDLAASATLTLDALGDANAVFIIKASSTLTIHINSTVSLINGAVWSNVFWYVGTTATINGGTTFNGIILAVTSITLDGSATQVTARLLANGGTVTINSGVLPVELESFTATANRANADLRWSTATEVNNYGFDIERRQTANWEQVGFVRGAGTSNSPRVYSYTDNNLSPGTYAYRIKQIDLDGSFKYYGNAEVEIMAPTEFALEPNFPNPFNPATTFSFSLPLKSVVSLKVFDALGREVSVVLSGELPAGKYSRQWNAASFPSGVYFYRLEAGSFVSTKKLILIK